MKKYDISIFLDINKNIQYLRAFNHKDIEMTNGVIEKKFEFNTVEHKELLEEILTFLNDPEIESVYEKKKKIHIDFRKIKCNIEFDNILDRVSKKSKFSSYAKEKFENDGIFIIDPEYYLRVEADEGYNLKADEYEYSNEELVELFIKKLKKEQYMLHEKYHEMVDLISEKLSLYQIKIVYTSEELTESAQEALDYIEEQTDDPKKQLKKEVKTHTVKAEVNLKDFVADDQWDEFVDDLFDNKNKMVSLSHNYIVLNFDLVYEDCRVVSMLKKKSSLINKKELGCLLSLKEEDPLKYLYFYKDVGLNVTDDKLKNLHSLMKEFFRRYYETRRFNKLSKDDKFPEIKRVIDEINTKLSEYNVYEENDSRRNLDRMIKFGALGVTVLTVFIILIFSFVL